VLPPQSIKLEILKKNIPSPCPAVFVETGTYYGATVEAMKSLYKNLISIEVNEALYLKACDRFKGDANVRIVHGDCVREMPVILSQIQEPAVFWLDGHYSGGETGLGEVEDPILISLDQIAVHPVKDHTIFVDDARTFDGREGRPDISEVFNRLKKINNQYVIRVMSDIIVATVSPLPVRIV
jgi:hypothetical protein